MRDAELLQGRLISFIDYCGCLTPRRTNGPIGQKLVRHSDPRAPVYCSLCWRSTVYTSAVHGSAEGSKRGSRRFCSFHDPADSTSQYRRDLPYRAAFDRERRAIVGIGPSAHKLRFEPVSYAEEDVRRAAYALVRSGLRGIKEQVFLLHSQGVSQAGIARRLQLKSASSIKGASISAPSTRPGRAHPLGFEVIPHLAATIN